MKKILSSTLLVLGIYNSTVNAQTIDTLVDVGKGKQLHFNIIKGKSTPILFEAGFGNGADVWKNITKQIAKVTDATIITYDRISYGDDPKNYQLSLDEEIQALETGLQKLGYGNKNIMLVSHSLGGMYNSYYASRHANEVKAAVLIDITTVCSSTSYFQLSKVDMNDPIEIYFANLLKTVREHPMPTTIPIIDIVAANKTDEAGNTDSIWINCHKEFVAQSPNRKPILAYTSHYVFVDNPALVIDAIISQYANYVTPKQKNAIIEKGYELALVMANESKKDEVKCGQKEEDVNTWGYSYLENNDIEKAIEVFKLNAFLNPESWNAFDSLAEAYLKAGNKELAIKNYKKSLELNPKNDNAINVLKEIDK
jgi:tetratricopeptide (TPR) repeat protein